MNQQQHHPNTVAVQIKEDIYRFYLAAAQREYGGNASAIINDELRKRMGDR